MIGASTSPFPQDYDTRLTHDRTDDKRSVKIGDCEAMFLNRKDYIVTYDYLDFGGTTQWLNGECIQNQGMNVGNCRFGSADVDAPIVMFVVPFLFSR